MDANHEDVPEPLSDEEYLEAQIAHQRKMADAIYEATLERDRKNAEALGNNPRSVQSESGELEMRSFGPAYRLWSNVSER